MSPFQVCTVAQAHECRLFKCLCCGTGARVSPFKCLCCGTGARVSPFKCVLWHRRTRVAFQVSVLWHRRTNVAFQVSVLWHRRTSVAFSSVCNCGTDARVSPLNCLHHSINARRRSRPDRETECNRAAYVVSCGQLAQSAAKPASCCCCCCPRDVAWPRSPRPPLPHLSLSLSPLSLPLLASLRPRLFSAGRVSIFVFTDEYQLCVLS